MTQWKLVAQKELVALCINWWLFTENGGLVGTGGSVGASSSEVTGGSLH
jgi:hypothetical protein